MEVQSLALCSAPHWAAAAAVLHAVIQSNEPASCCLWHGPVLNQLRQFSVANTTLEIYVYVG